MLQRALIQFDKTVFLRKNCYKNGLIMCIVVHKTRHQKHRWIADKRSSIISPRKRMNFKTTNSLSF